VINFSSPTCLTAFFCFLWAFVFDFGSTCAPVPELPEDCEEYGGSFDCAVAGCQWLSQEQRVIPGEGLGRCVYPCIYPTCDSISADSACYYRSWCDFVGCKWNALSGEKGNYCDIPDKCLDLSVTKCENHPDLICDWHSQEQKQWGWWAGLGQCHEIEEDLISGAAIFDGGLGSITGDVLRLQPIYRGRDTQCKSKCNAFDYYKNVERNIKIAKVNVYGEEGKERPMGSDTFNRDHHLFDDYTDTVVIAIPTYEKYIGPIDTKLPGLKGLMGESFSKSQEDVKDIEKRYNDVKGLQQDIAKKLHEITDPTGQKRLQKELEEIDKTPLDTEKIRQFQEQNEQLEKDKNELEATLKTSQDQVETLKSQRDKISQYNPDNTINPKYTELSNQISHLKNNVIPDLNNRLPGLIGGIKGNQDSIRKELNKKERAKEDSQKKADERKNQGISKANSNVKQQIGTVKRLYPKFETPELFDSKNELDRQIIMDISESAQDPELDRAINLADGEIRDEIGNVDKKVPPDSSALDQLMNTKYKDEFEVFF